MKKTFAILLMLIFVSAAAWANIPPTGPEMPPEEAFPEFTGTLPTPLHVRDSASIAYALDEANQEEITLENKVVTGRFTEDGITFMYVQEPDRSAGIRVDSALGVSPGDWVNVSGTLGIAGGERRLANASASKIERPSAVLRPLAMDNSTLGGMDFNLNTPGVTGAIGPYNKGLLVMSWGKVISSQVGLFYMEDGSGISVKVLTPGTSPTVGHYVIVTGVCSSYVYGQDNRRLIRMRSGDDLVDATTADPPIITTITSPAGLLNGPGGSGFAFIGLPGVPVDPDPESVFEDVIPYLQGDPATLDENLFRYEVTGDPDYPHPYVYYPESQIHVPGQQQLVTFLFGNCYSGQGYWLNIGSTGGSISYQAVMGPIQDTDRYIALPRAPFTCIGNPFNRSVLYQSVLVTDGGSVLPIIDAQMNGWMWALGFWWQCSTQSQLWLCAQLPWANPETEICMEPWGGYWMGAGEGPLALIVPAQPSETMTVTADPAFLASGGTSEITAKLTLRSGGPMREAAVTFTTTAGTLSDPTPEYGLTDENGEVKVTLTLATGQSATVTASTAFACPSPMTASCTVTHDGTAPSTPIVTDDGEFTTSASELHARWAAYDAESGISGYRYAIGTTPGGTNVLDWTDTTLNEATETNLSLSANTTYYFAVKAKNGAGTLSIEAGVSDGIVCSPSRVIHVKPTGSDSNSGLTWDLAKLTVQGGINAASSSQEVWVAEGTYAPTSTISITSGVALYGGFDGTEHVRSARDWKTHETVLDGSNNTTSSVLTCSNISGATLDGFMITNGVAGGLYAGWCSSLTVAHNILRDNHSGYGAGVYCDHVTYVTIADNLLADNAATHLGGGMYFVATSGTAANNTLVCNTAGLYAGGIYCSDSPGLVIANSIVADNVIDPEWAEFWGGGVHVSSTPPTLTHNCIWGNTGLQYSGMALVFAPVSGDPLFVNEGSGDYRLSADSPCRNVGVEEQVMSTRDLDANSRVQGNAVDLGAYEYADGTYYHIDVDLGTHPVAAGSPVTVSAAVTDPLNGPVAYAQVHFLADGGSVPASQVPADANGIAQTNVTRDTPGLATLTASVYVPRCQAWASKSVRLYFCAPEGMSADWPMFMHDPQHSGLTLVEDTSEESLTLEWSAELHTSSSGRPGTCTWLPHNEPGGPYGGCIFEHPFIDSSPAVAGATVVVGAWTRGTYYYNAEGCVSAFDAESGTLTWRFPTDTAQHIGGVASTPCIADDRVYVGSTDGYLYCLDLASGSQIWAQPTYSRTPSVPSKILGSPVIHDGIVYIGNEAAKVYAFDTAGTLQQGYPVVLPIDDAQRDSERRITNLTTQNMTGTSSPAIATVGDAEYLVLGCDDGYIYRITLGVSDPQSTFVCVDLGYCVESSPTIVGDRAYVGVSHYGGAQLYRLSVDPFAVVVTADANFPWPGEECRATLAFDGGEHLYVGLDTGYTLHKLALDTLENATWPFALGETNYFVGSAAICRNGLLYVGNDDAAFRALALSDLSQSAIYYSGEGYICSSPAIAYNVDSSHNRWVYVTTRDGNGRLLAFKTER